VRTSRLWTAVPIALLALACRDTQPTDDLASDLALIAAAQIELAPAGGTGATVISEVENVSVPSPRSTSSPTRRRAPKVPPPVEIAVAAPADETSSVAEVVAVAESDASAGPSATAAEPAPELAPAVRPRPIEPPAPVGAGTVFGRGDDRGTEGGGIGVVIRGGRTGRDPCEIHDRRGGRPGGIGVLINDRVRGRPTFPRY